MHQISKLIKLKIKSLDKKTKRQKQFINWQNIHKILLIIDTGSSDTSQISSIEQFFSGKNVKTIILTSDTNFSETGKFFVAYKKQLLFFKYLKIKHIQYLLDEHFDAALAYSNGELWAIALVLAQTRAKLRITNAQELSDITDITIMPKENSLTGFVSQTIKYLQTIKPSKNAK